MDNNRINQYKSHNPGMVLLDSREGELEEEHLLHLYLHSLGYGKYKDDFYEFTRKEIIKTLVKNYKKTEL